MTITTTTIDTTTDDLAPVSDSRLEQGVLGAMIRSADTAAAVLDIVRPDAFYDGRHQLIATEIAARLHREPTDVIALEQHLRATGELHRAGGPVYLVELLQGEVAGDPAWHAQQLADIAMRRRLEAVAIRAQQVARTPTIAVDDAVQRIQADVHDATAARTAASARVAAWDTRIDDLYGQWVSPTDERGISTGIGALDDIIGRLQASRMTVIAGRPGMGKTVLAIDIARAAVFRQHESVAFFSAEMCLDEIQTRIVSAESGVRLKSLTHTPRDGITRDEADQVRPVIDRLRGAPLTIDDTPGITVSHIRTVCRRLQQTTGLDMVIVDYLQKLRPDRPRENRAVEVGDISGQLKELARELGVPVVVAAQINRENAARADKRPQLTDLRESGAIEADADAVVLLHRPSYYCEDDAPGESELIVAKNRSGETGVARVAAQFHVARHTDMGLPVEDVPR